MQDVCQQTRKRMREMEEDQRQLRRRILELEETLLLSQQDPAITAAAQAESGKNDVESKVLPVSEASSSVEEEDPPPVLYVYVPVNKDSAGNCFYLTDAEALTDWEDDDDYDDCDSNDGRDEDEAARLQ